jgi:hypothetical protein
LERILRLATYDFDALINNGSLVEIIHEKAWKEYELLSDLVAGSDYDGDSAWYWSNEYPVGKGVLNRITFQWTVDDVTWNDCVAITGSEGTSVFPGNNNAKAAAGFYLPFLSYHPGKLESIQFRALVPKELARKNSHS